VDGTGIAIAGGVIILILVVVVVGSLLFAIAWYISFMFALPLIAEHDIGPMEAIKLSFKAGWANPGGLVLLLILNGLLGLLGVLMLCIGVFFVLPIIFAASAFAYRQVFPLLDASPFRSTPPPPTEYGGSFGRGM
jgi:uncharacterized membrane protein